MLREWPRVTLFDLCRRKRGGVGCCPSEVCRYSNFQSIAVCRFWFQIRKCILNSIIICKELVKIYIKMLHGHFTKLINYAAVSVSCVSLKQSCLITANHRCFSRWRQNVPGICSHHREGTIAECWAACWWHDRRRCWSRPEMATDFYVMHV